MKRLHLWALALGLTTAVASAQAGKTVDVARLKVGLSDDSWQVSEEMPFRREVSSAQGSFAGASKVMTLRDADGKALALLYVAATWGKPQVYNRYSACPANSRVYARDLNVNKNENIRCLYFGGPYDTASLLKGALPSLQDAATTMALAHTDTAFYMNLFLTAHGGVHIYVEGLFAPGFVGIANGTPVGEAPPSLKPGTAAWADAFAASALEALTSFSGALPVPALAFEAAPK